MGVQKKADHGLNFGAVAIGERYSDQNVLLSGVTIKQHVQRGGDDGKHADRFAFAAIPQGKS